MSSNEPIYVLNMLKFKEHAAYPEDSEYASSDISGAEAYDRYSKSVRPLIEKAQAQLSVSWQVEQTFIGQGNSEWDRIFVVRYPSLDAFRSMIDSPEYQAVVEHRQAAVESSWAIRMSDQKVMQTDA